jgi:hypothetical protein
MKHLKKTLIVLMLVSLVAVISAFSAGALGDLPTGRHGHATREHPKRSRTETAYRSDNTISDRCLLEKNESGWFQDKQQRNSGIVDAPICRHHHCGNFSAVGTLIGVDVRIRCSYNTSESSSEISARHENGCHRHQAAVKVRMTGSPIYPLRLHGITGRRVRQRKPPLWDPPSGR